MPVEYPVLQVTIDSLYVPGVIFLEIESVGFFSADRFRIGFSLGSGALNSISYFISLGMKTINIDAALDGSEFANIITGQIDNISIELSENIAVLTGRDLSARLIDTEISETFSNQTSSQIATLIAVRNQLIPNVTPTSMTIGQYYEIDHARTGLGLNSRTTTEWNLLSSLAKIENFILSVSGSTLNFGTMNYNSPVFMSPDDFILLNFDIATTLPKNVNVKSWNSRNKISVFESAGNFNGKSTTIIRPNLSSQQSLKLAKSHLSILNQHYTILLGTVPGELTLMPGMQISLNGTNSSLDQIYNISMVRRIFQDRNGFVETIQAYLIN